MPVFRSDSKIPAWCEMEGFEFIEIPDGQSISLERKGEKEEIVVCKGLVKAESGAIACQLPEGQKMDLNDASLPGFKLSAIWGDAMVVRMFGRWESVTSSGIFPAFPADPPSFDTPYDYVKTTGFDNHYHDCDEYWIMVEGKCRVVSEGKFYDVGPGDCVATGMGWHHDVQSVEDGGPVRGVWFEGTLEGQKRLGHLWEPKNGKAVPEADRV